MVCDFYRIVTLVFIIFLQEQSEWSFYYALKGRWRKDGQLQTFGQRPAFSGINERRGALSATYVDNVKTIRIFDSGFTRLTCNVHYRF